MADTDPSDVPDAAADDEFDDGEFDDDDIAEIFRATAEKRKKQAIQMGLYGIGSLALGVGTFLASSSFFEAEGLSQDAVWVIGYGSLLFGIPLTIFAIILYINALMLASRHGNPDGS